MKKCPSCLKMVLAGLIFAHLLFPVDCHAYLDAGTGSFMIQALIAFFVGGLFMLKIYFKKVKTFFRKLFSKKDTGEHPEQ